MYAGETGSKGMNGTDGIRAIAATEKVQLRCPGDNEVR